MAFGQMFGMLLSGGPTAAAEGLIPQSIAKQTAKTLSSPMAVSGALQASVPEFEAAKQAGKTDEEAFNVFLKNIPGGLTEVLPIANMFGKINKMTGNGIVNAFKSSTAQGLEEGSQEAVQTFLTNKIAQGSYDPKRDLQQGILEGAGTGFLVGFLMPGIMGAMSKMTPEQKSETQSIIENKLKTPVIPEPIVSPAQVVSEARTSVKSADDTQGAENAAEKILEATQSPNATEGQQLTTQTDGQERNGQGRQEGLLTQETGGWKAGDIIPANYPQPERVIKSVDADLSDTMVKVTFEDGTKGAIQKKKPTPVVEEKPAETKQSTPAQAIDKYENDEKFTIDDLVDELESSDDPKIQEAVSKYRADVREGLEVWGGREDSEARETGFVNEVRKITGETPSQTPTGLEKTSGIFYRVDTGMTQSKNATAKDIVDFEADELGNEDVQIGREKAKEMGIDLSQYSHKDIVWVTKSKEAAERYGASEDVQEVPIQSGTVIAEDGDGGYLILKGKPTEKPQSQQPTPDITTVGDNYVKRDNKWYVKDAEGIERPLISDNPNKTQEEQNTELAQLKELKAQLETETPVKVDLSPTGKSRIAEMEAFSPEGRVRKWLFGGGQLLWNSKSQGEGKPTLRGLKDETGYSNKERQDIKQYVHDTNGVSVEQAAEQLAAQYQDRSPQEYRNAIIEVFSSDPKKWYEQQVRDEDPDYAMQEEQRFQEAGQLNEQIKQLETQEEGVRETNQQLYENERRVNYGSPAAEGQAAGGQVASPGSGSQTQVQPRESIRKNGDANKSKQALEEIKSKNLTHVPGLGMGANQAKGTYVSTEEEGSRYARRGTPVKVKVNVQNPFVSEDDVFYDIQREIIQSRFGKEKIEDLTETEADLLAEMVTEHFTTEGFDSIYMPQSETQEGELIVFDRSKVTIMDDARIEYENAVHASTQTTLQLEFIPDAEFLKTDKPIELREKQKKVRKDLARLNQLIKCR